MDPGVDARGARARRSLARMSTAEFHEQRAMDREQLDEDLELVCTSPPVLEPEHSAEKIMLAVGSAVDSALHKVSSRLGSLVSLDGAPAASSPPWVGCGWAQEAPPHRRMRHVRTSPTLLIAGGQAAAPGGAAPHAARWAAGRRPPGGLMSDAPVAGLLGEGVSIIWQASMPDFQDDRECEGGMSVVTVSSDGGLNFGMNMPLPLNPLLRRSSTALKSWASEEDIRLRLLSKERGMMLQSREDRAQVGQGQLQLVPSVSSMERSVTSVVESRSSILDFEHLFCQFYVGVTLRRRGKFSDLFHRASHSCKAVRPSLPDAQAVAVAWKAEALECLWKNRHECQRRWPEMRLPGDRAPFCRKLAPLFEAEVSWQDELRGPHKRLVLALEPERVCHRLLWAVGDAIPPEQILCSIQEGIARRFPHCSVRCADGLWSPAGIFQILMIVFTLLLAAGVHSLMSALPAAVQAMSAPIDPKGRVDMTALTREERMDQLAARCLLTGSLLQLWLLHAVAAAFPLRSLHSPFRRDLGCLAAYSRAASMLVRYLGPVAALAMPAAMAVRWNRMGRWVGKYIAVLLVPTAERQIGWHTASFCCSAGLPVLTIAAAWSVRSSFYSYHHLFITLLFLSHLTAAFFFAVSFELVRWAMLGAGGVVALGVLLFRRYTAEFTNASLLKAAQLQWACAHVVPVLGLLLSAALEVEAGFAMALIDFICESQDVIPVKMCIRMLRNSG